MISNTFDTTGEYLFDILNVSTGTKNNFFFKSCWLYNFYIPLVWIICVNSILIKALKGGNLNDLKIVVIMTTKKIVVLTPLLQDFYFHGNKHS